MSKRRAGVELTHENWDQEDDEVEEAGTFAVADKDILSKRPMIKARRRVASKQQDGSQPPAQTPFAAFKGFSGFGGSTQVSSASFSFKPDSSGSSTVSQTPSATFSFKPASTGSSTISQTQSLSSSSKPVSVTVKPLGDTKPTFSFKPTTESQPSTNMFTLNKSETDSKSSSNGSAFPANPGNGRTDMEAYADEIKALNRSVSAWIQKHVESNPVCDLTPIFDDYKKHFGEIEKKQAKRKEEGEKEQQSKLKPQLATVSPLSCTEHGKSSSSTAASFSGFKFGGAPTAATESEKASTATKVSFSFGGASSDNKGFSFGSSTSSSTFGSSGAKFSFGDALKPASSSSTNDDKEEEEESDEPPKVEVKVIEEKDSLYSTRCKVFYKKGSEFKERGVGMLHVKDTGGSAQLLIRADTSLGNVILNIGVTSAMVPHFTKQGKNKNNVMLLSPLNPPADKKCPKCNKNYINPQESTSCEEGCTPTPTPLLLRVKSEADADKLIEEIKKICED